MTRASLLHILDHVGSISEAENQELVQLATAFPYCQTAHLLLAKAAHDKGSMLASQRLRRAATYAADRQLLRLLMEQPDAVLPAPSVAPLIAELPTTESGQLALPAAPTEESQVEPEPIVAEAPTPIITEEVALLSITIPPVALAPAEALIASVDADVVIPPAATVQPTAEQEEAEAELPLETSADQEAVVELPEVPAATIETDSESTCEAPTLTDADDLLPAAAPPIRPPADAGLSRFEFGLADTPPLPAMYELLDNVSVAPAPPAGTVASPAFYTDPTLGYGLDLGSRLGASLQHRGAYTTDLPPTEFFSPDALLLAHINAHEPTLPAPQKTLAIIDQFLKNQPRLKTPAVVPPTEEQADLSVPSTSATPALASESLAKIMVKQGKTTKAIEIYERLMMRQPEKKAYFADQIAQLKSAD